MRKSVLVGALVVCSLMVLSSSVVLAADNWNGNWKLDLAKSKYTPPGAAPKSLTLKFEATPAGTKITADGVDAEGKPIKSSWTSKMDGKEVPWENNPNADTASPQKVDDNTYTNTWKKDGKVTVTAKVVVSADGKTLTVTQTGKNAKGEAVNITAVYDKQ
jgi:hypothetical protein